MKKVCFRGALLLILLQLIFTGALLAQEELPEASQEEHLEVSQEDVLKQRADSLLNATFFHELTGYRPGDSILIERVIELKKPRRFRLYTTADLSWTPFRYEVLDLLFDSLATALDKAHERYGLELYAGKKNVLSLVPNYYQPSKKEMDGDRYYGKLDRKTAPLVRSLSSPWRSEAALYNLNLAIWHSHGCYYEPELDRWEWQRARLFQTVEDIYPMAYTLPFLVPMLENAGARVLMPRERDVQREQVIVDNNGSEGLSIYLPARTMEDGPDSSGFALGTSAYVDENPFRLGTWSSMSSSRSETDLAQWIPDIPKKGAYAVYVSYHASDDHVDDALYRVYHAGGRSDFLVNQQMGGGTWIYLGHFLFGEGIDAEKARVELLNKSAHAGRVISADAVRFGGGMGSVSREGKLSMRPRYQEAARYYLQFAGVPDSLAWKLNENDDYKDDYQSRGEWVNYLKAPLPGSKEQKKAAKKNGAYPGGLAIPVDLSFAFHTDAGITDNDTVIGTLGIYSTTYNGKAFPDGLSKMASRDLTDLVQTQIVDDLRALYDPTWTRRGMWDKAYSEAYRPLVPTMLLELFSHQNFLDMQFGQEPMFRMQVSRAIYKGMLKFLSLQYGLPYVVQPLPVTHMHSEIEEQNIHLSWKQQQDPLEPSARASAFVVYIRKGEGGFDNGTRVSAASFTLENAEPGVLYSFRVTALNGGGESLPSEILAAGLAKGARGTLAIISAFDRVSGPARFDDEQFGGFMNMIDEGVAWEKDIHTVGIQYDYFKGSPWLDDDSPGHGASYADMEDKLIPGNNFDHSSLHGASMLRAGYSFVSISDEALEDGYCDISGYPLVDFLAGEEKSTFMPKNDSVIHFQIWTPAMLEALSSYLEQGGKLFVNGAHIASDAYERGQDKEVGELLGFTWRTSNASRLGRVTALDSLYYSRGVCFNSAYDPEIYKVEGADAIEPADTTARTIFRYTENNMSAGVVFGSPARVLSTGFPFEAIPDRKARDLFMKETINYLLHTNE